MLKRSLLLIFPGLLAWLLIDQYIICPGYRFESPGPFKGDTFYNPYQHFNPEEWTLTNMHAHTNSWFGMTNGKGDAKEVFEAYDSMGYGFHLISEYQKISDYGKDAPNYITAYEHGINIPKGHQLVIGSKQATWKDYFFPHTLANRQHMLDILTEDTGNVVVMNHPAMRTGYEPTDMKFLYNYDCMEVINSWKVLSITGIQHFQMAIWSLSSEMMTHMMQATTGLSGSSLPCCMPPPEPLRKPSGRSEKAAPSGCRSRRIQA